VRHTEKPVRVLKIMGLGRSGSTILDIVLGNHPQIESVGEVGNLIRTGWISQSKEPMHQHRRKDTLMRSLHQDERATKSSCSASTGSLATESGRCSLKRLSRGASLRRGGEERAQR
jgi:hypothetical protein